MRLTSTMNLKSNYQTKTNNNFKINNKLNNNINSNSQPKNVSFGSFTLLSAAIIALLNNEGVKTAIHHHSLELAKKLDKLIQEYKNKNKFKK